MWFIFNWLSWLTSLVLQLWNILPEQAKRKIIELVISAMEEIIRAYYKNYKNEGQDKK
ncbi:MAG: hypothetical protein CLLPBCKN_005224 [Chroococcidiopsis cubana SAG 39.79]|jgi:hypothetical protein|uniref:Uncharacterized protein n=2 Tax=Chroococcidiopsis TaxID=54298 RepID=K9U4F5_CHRTP|nr:MULTISPECIES: hypothetical protein [Chroococcidiopsis]AFY89705.1 hypothetical protein Chro_4309 [Chroococcidiopsis thermalis PCC 7203]MDZ4875804.1 hypothetical protein [Chroococcidiopsis cubana SAG 39.79]RUT07497.1 hypothetical protein DSM107010_49690 [Chroococcidiopsis cubana SAG 39.79]URD49087.1 hypothetical protein M5J74_22520 [Chroococcidiopsis sp. CCNUC1]